MRPIRLDIRGFTAFREPQVLDFDGLDLFAISGPTGAGKSSILDALTFALYGRAERVGDGVRQLVSQGQPRAAVVLEFETGAERYRVARSVTADAKTKILVEHADPTTETGWRQAGDGADRVREADAMIERFVGLDYAGFTRAVLLPQGRFAEFLAGDAKTRRRILADLLDLGLFERIAAKAGELARMLGAQVTGKTEILGSEFGEASEEGLAAARETHAQAEAVAARAAAARETVAALLIRGAALDREADELTRLETEAERQAVAARGVADEIAGLVTAISASEVGRTAALTTAGERAEAFSAAAAALSELEASWGDAVTIAGRLERARALVLALGALAERRAELATLAAAVAPAEIAAVHAGVAAAAAAERESTALDAERAAVDALEAARAADRVAAVSAGLAIGDPCPVCGRPLDALPDRHGVPGLAAATAALERGRASAAEASAAARVAERTSTEAVGRLERERDRLAQAQAMLEDLERGSDAAATTLALELGGELPQDAVGELERRAEGLRAAATDLETRRSASTRADVAVREIERLIGEARARLTTERVRLEAIPLADLEARVAAAGTGDVGTGGAGTGGAGTGGAGTGAGAGSSAAAVGRRGRAAAPAAASAEPEDPSTVAATAVALAARLDELRAAAGTAAADRRAGTIGLVNEARSALGDLPLPATIDLAGIARVVDSSHGAAVGAAAVAARRIEELEAKFHRRAELETEIEALKARGARFKQLAQELRQDRIVAFLQEEALASLAAAGSIHLEDLSSGRYRLDVVDDEFLVVDTWNGEERRSVKTLSGGESFLASLGLALALSEQVPSLAANARSRVTSLFLDEGFGTLDEETLQVVISAVEVLGGEDRMVGVVTHMAELAERLPARVIVEKSPRGSTIRRV